MKVAAAIRTKLTDALAPAKLTIIDESDRHAGHAGSRPEGETHFQVTVVSSAFEGKSRLERQRMIYGVLAAELADRAYDAAYRLAGPGANGPDFQKTGRQDDPHHHSGPVFLFCRWSAGRRAIRP